MRVLDLFSGIGMFSYAFHKLGWETVAFVEQDKWCQQILAKHYPDVPIYDDVKDITYERFEKDGIKAIDLICGGFPCQDISVAGKQTGIDGKRSGLWGEFARIIGEFKPRWVVVENVSALLSGDDGRWMGRVCGDLAQVGYDCEWHVIPAGNLNGLSAGAPHRRERVWIVAYPKPARAGNKSKQVGLQKRGTTTKGRKTVRQTHRAIVPNRTDPTSSDVAYTGSNGPQRVRETGKIAGQAGLCDRTRKDKKQAIRQTNNSGPTKPSLGLLAHGIAAELSGSRWLAEPGIGRVATGVPDRVNKLKALGNSLVWKIPYAIGRAIIEAEK